jgi:D-cysteine desulfhydrase
MRPIFERSPRLRGRVPFEPLAALPTPVEERGGIWLKRDDRIGGGKIRKLEFYRPPGPLLAVGSEGSNWLRALARRPFPMRIHTWPQHHNAHSRRNVPFIPGTRHRDELLFGLRMLGELPRVLGGNCFLAPVGGSDPTTTLGFVNAALELAAQVREGALPRPDAVFVALGTCGTAAGLALGLALAGLEDVALHAVRITDGLFANLGRVRRLAAATARLLDEAPRTCRLVLETGFYGGYGRPTAAGIRAQAHFAPLDLDASYAAKAAACALSRRGAYRAPLLWVTSGTPPANP